MWYKEDVRDPCQKRITDTIITFVSGTLQSLSVVEAEEFKNMIEVMDPRATIPSRKHLSTKLLNERLAVIRVSNK